jgi:pimeloyl-ACP methyl ester carboxylesterase
MNASFTESAGIPLNEAVSVSTYSPVVLPVPGRPVDLEVKVSAPVTGSGLPVILLSHGHGSSNFLSSLHGYAPLADFFAAHGFVVLQPTHLDSSTYGLRGADDPDAPLYWRSRAHDMHHLLDHLDTIEKTVPGLGGRLDRGRIAAVGHSLGGLTASMLIGQRVGDPAAGPVIDLSDPRVKAAAILAGPGRGEDMSDQGTQLFPDLRHVDFSHMTIPALVVNGEKDINPMFSEQPNWRAGGYYHSPAPKTLLTLLGATHSLGGVAGYDAKETTDESPERVATQRALIWAYLRSALYPGETAWSEAVAALEAMPAPPCTVESK